MRKPYIAPTLEVQFFELNSAVAACGNPVNYGPGQADNDFKDMCSDWDLFGTASIAVDTSFYQYGTTCTCYYSSGGEGYVSSW